jgi:hypothetical protein
VFGGSFEVQDGDNGVSTACLRLSFNSVRLAHRDARLGYIPPEQLLRGISLKSVSSGTGRNKLPSATMCHTHIAACALDCVGGGPVFAVRATVLRVCPVMCKVSRSSTGTQEESRAVLSVAEASVLHGALQDQRRKIMDSVDRAEELKLENLLDDLSCDQEIVDAMLVSDVFAHDRASFVLI